MKWNNGTIEQWNNGSLMLENSTHLPTKPRQTYVMNILWMIMAISNHQKRSSYWLYNPPKLYNTSSCFGELTSYKCLRFFFNTINIAKGIPNTYNPMNAKATPPYMTCSPCAHRSEKSATKTCPSSTPGIV